MYARMIDITRYFMRWVCNEALCSPGSLWTLKLKQTRVVERVGLDSLQCVPSCQDPIPCLFFKCYFLEIQEVTYLFLTYMEL